MTTRRPPLCSKRPVVGTTERLELVLVDRGGTERAARRLGTAAGVQVRRVGWDEPQLDDAGRRVFRR